MGSYNDVFFGPTHLKQPGMSILLVFPGAGDLQSESLRRAAEAGQYSHHVTVSTDDAVKLYAVHHHSVVFVDTRPPARIDAEAFCRQIRSCHHGDAAILVAIRPQILKPKDSSENILPLLKAGYNRQFVENHSVSICLDELQSLEYGECRTQSKLAVAQALFTAVENSNDAIEITDDNHRILYVNPTFERLFGYKGDEIKGKNFPDLAHSEVARTEIIETINSQLRSGRMWDGAYHMRRKTGESLPHKCRLIPVVGNSGKMSHLVAIRSAVLERRGSTELTNGIAPAHGSAPSSAKQRKESITRLPFMAIEAPITKAINLICSIREDSPTHVAVTLDAVLEVLRSSELYAPHLTQQVRDDLVVNNLVEGLMTMDDEFRLKKQVSSVKRGSCCSDTPPNLPTKIRNDSQMSLAQESPEIQRLLEREAEWGFPIIELERLTKKKKVPTATLR